MKSNTSKHFYFNHERRNFEEQPKRKISTPTTKTENNVIGPLSGTTTPKHMFSTKLSSSSTSSINSCTLSVINGNDVNSYMSNQFNSYNQQMNGQQMTVNPFEETNRFRLEQSVLSPNLFHVANTSTPERDTNSLWNIDQRAILYPADIQTDESSLMAQYVYDYKISKQVIPAVEAFWTQNKIIIESPLACTTGSAFRSKFASQTHMAKHGKANSVNSPLSNEMLDNFNAKKTTTASVSGGSTSNLAYNKGEVAKKHQQAKASCKDQVCQTILQIPIDFDLTKILELKNFFITDGADATSSSPTKELNNSIRKKLFDQNSEDLSTSTTTTTTTTGAADNQRNFTTGAAILMSKIKSANLELTASTQKQQHISQLPKPEMYTDPNSLKKKDHLKLRTLASSSSSATCDDGWLNDFDDHQFASSPKCEKFSNIIHDIGDFGHDDELHDSVFEQQHRTPPDLSPLLSDDHDNNNITAKKPAECRTPSHRENTLLMKSSDHVTHKSHHHNRFFNVDTFNSMKRPDASGPSNASFGPVTTTGSASKKDKNMISPNLSPIRQQQNQLSTSTSTLQGSSLKQKRVVNSSNKDRTLPPHVNDDMNVSSSSAAFARSIVFMDVGDDEIVADLGEGDRFRSSKEIQDLSFCEEVIGYEHHNHYKREEFYKRVSLGGDDFESEIELCKLADHDKHTKIDMITNADDRTMNGPHRSKEDASKNHHHQHDKVSTTSCSNSSSRSSNYEACTKGYITDIHLNTSKPLLSSMIETTTDTGYQTNNGTCGNGSTSINSAQSSSNPSIMIMDTTNSNNNNVNCSDINSMLTFNRMIKTSNVAMSIGIEDFKENNHCGSNVVEKSLAAKKADLLNLKNSLKSFIAASSKRPLNSNDRNKSLLCQPKSSTKAKNPNSISLNSLENIIKHEPFTENFNSSSHFKPIKNAAISQAINPRKVNFIKSKSGLEQQDKNNDYRPPSCKMYKSRSETGERLINEEQPVTCSSDISMCTLNNSNVRSVSIYELDDDEKMVKKKHELDSQYMDQSILLNKITPSEYAKCVLSKAKKDLEALASYLGQE